MIISPSSAETVPASGVADRYAMMYVYVVRCSRQCVWWSDTDVTTGLQKGNELSFKFGTDEFLYCGWHLASSNDYHFAAKVIKQEGMTCSAVVAVVVG